MPRNQENETVGEVIGLTLLGLGTLLFLALISYQPRDVPSWVPILAASAAAPHAHFPGGCSTLNGGGQAGHLQNQIEQLIQGE